MRLTVLQRVQDALGRTHQIRATLARPFPYVWQPRGDLQIQCNFYLIYKIVVCGEYSSAEGYLEMALDFFPLPALLSLATDAVIHCLSPDVLYLINLID